MSDIFWVMTGSGDSAESVTGRDLRQDTAVIDEWQLAALRLRCDFEDESPFPDFAPQRHPAIVRITR